MFGLYVFRNRHDEVSDIIPDISEEHFYKQNRQNHWSEMCNQTADW